MSERVDYDPAAMPRRDFYKLMTAVVVPRPIAWVASRDADGHDNLAPHSFFTVANVDPPVVQFTSVGVKDTLRNVLATREFVVCLTPEALFDEVNRTGTDFAAGVSEFDAVGLTREPSRTVAVPRVAESPVAIECRLAATTSLGDCTVVFGQVTHIAVDAAAVRDGHPQIDLLRPLARLGGDEWSAIGRVASVARIRARDWDTRPAALGWPD